MIIPILQLRKPRPRKKISHWKLEFKLSRLVPESQFLLYRVIEVNLFEVKKQVFYLLNLLLFYLIF